MIFMIDKMLSSPNWQLAIGNRQFFLFLHRLARLLHLPLELLDLDQVTGIERQRRVVTIRLMRTETSVMRFLASCLHRG